MELNLNKSRCVFGLEQAGNSLWISLFSVFRSQPLCRSVYGAKLELARFSINSLYPQIKLVTRTVVGSQPASEGPGHPKHTATLACHGGAHIAMECGPQNQGVLNTTLELLAKMA